MKEKASLSLFIAWLVTLIAFIATLYGSEVAKMPICHLCWYQRVCMYPLIIILGIASWRNDVGVKVYTLPLSIIGALFALYQYLEQMIPGFAPINLCGTGVDCSAVHFKWLGFITFPFLSLIAFLIITVALFFSRTKTAL